MILYLPHLDSLPAGAESGNCHYCLLSAQQTNKKEEKCLPNVREKQNQIRDKKKELPVTMLHRQGELPDACQSQSLLLCAR